MLQAIDNAKKRAVAQKVDYDTFKNMVCAGWWPRQAGAAVEQVLTNAKCAGPDSTSEAFAGSLYAQYR